MAEPRSRPTGGGLRASALRVGALLLVAWAVAVVYLAMNEDRMVFVGAGAAPGGGVVPAAGAAVPWDSTRVEGEDGASVFLLESRLEGGGERPWALFFHGNGLLVGDGGSVERFALLRRAGFHVLAVEFRGYGASAAAGAPSEEALYADARTALRHLTGARGVPPERVVAYGWSLGSGPATWLAANERLGGLVTEGAFTAAPELGALQYPWVPVRTIMRNRFDNLARADSVAERWLVLHGRSDEVVPFEHAGALAAAAPAARLVPLEAGHDDGVMADRETALAALRGLAEAVAGGEVRDSTGGAR